MFRSVYERFCGAANLDVLSGSATDQTNLLFLPPEIFEEIFVKLPVRDFFISMVVCKAWRKIGLSGFHTQLDSVSPWYKKTDIQSPILIHGHSVNIWLDPRDGETKFLLYGGWTPDRGVNGSLFVYSKRDTQNLWTNKNDTLLVKGAPLFAHSGSVVGNRLYVFGGSNGRDKYTNDIYCIDLFTATCTALKPSGPIPSPRAYHRAIVMGNRILVFGGQMTLYKNSKKQPLWYNDINIYDTETNTWTPITTTGTPPPACGAGSLLLFKETQIIYFGGGLWNKFVHCPEDIHYFNDTYKLDTVTWNWTMLTVTGIPPSPRAGHAAVLIGNHMLVSAGYLTLGHRWPTFQDTFLLNLDTLEWKQSHSIGEKMGNHVMIVDDNFIYLIGGIDYDSSLTSCVYYATFSETMQLLAQK